MTRLAGVDSEENRPSLSPQTVRFLSAGVRKSSAKRPQTATGTHRLSPV
jgi:hypothetical protein